MSAAMPFIKPRRLDLPFLLLLCLIVVMNLPISPLTLQNDTTEAMQYFFSFYNEFFLHGRLQLWDPYFYFGLPTDFRQIVTLSYAVSFTTVLGKLFHVTNAFTVYKAALVLEQMVNVAGMYLLGGRLIGNRKAVWFVGLCAALTNIWYLQVWFDFRNYSLLPLALYFIVRFFEDYKPWRLFAAALVYLVSALGSTGYFLPMLSPILLVFGVSLGVLRRKELAANWRSRALFSPFCLVLLALVLATAFAFLDFNRAMLQNMTVAGYAGRDPLTGNATLESFLHTLSAPNKAISSFWELLFVAPRDWIFTVYSGIFSLVLAGYAIFHRRDILSPAFVPLLLSLAFCAAMALGSLNIVAPALYFLYPLMNKARYLLAFLGPLKMFLILLAGLGLDLFLAHMTDMEAEQRRKVRVAGWLALGLCVFALVVDIAFAGKGFPYQAENFIPYAYHFIPLAMAAGFAFFLLTASQPSRAFCWGLMVLVAVDLASYQFFFFLNFGTDASSRITQTVRDSKSLTERQFQVKLQEALNIYHVRPYAYQPKRLKTDQLRSFAPQAWRAMTIYNFIYADYLNAFYLDVWDPSAHRAYFSQGLSRLQKAILGLDLDEPLHDASPWLMDRIMDNPARFVGSNRPKAYLAGEAVEAVDMADAAEYLHEIASADVRPVILPALRVYGAIPESQKRQRAMVYTCHQGDCQEASPGEPSFWDGHFSVYPGMPVSVLYAFPRERELTRYRLAVNGPEDQRLMPTRWRLSGSNDGVHWTDLDQRFDPTPWRLHEHRDYPLAAPAKHRYYLFTVDQGATPGRLSLGRVSLLRYGNIPPVATPEIPAEVTDYSVNALTMQVRVPQGADRWLIYLDNSDPGWLAWVDGVRVPLCVANLAFKAVKLSSGEHIVRFEYVGRGNNRFYLHYFLILGASFGLWAALLVARTATLSAS